MKAFFLFILMLLPQIKYFPIFQSEHYLCDIHNVHFFPHSEKNGKISAQMSFTFHPPVASLIYDRQVNFTLEGFRKGELVYWLHPKGRDQIISKHDFGNKIIFFCYEVPEQHCLLIEWQDSYLKNHMGGFTRLDMHIPRMGNIR